MSLKSDQFELGFSIEEKLQCGADNAKGWSRQNNMHINYDKTNYMILCRSNKQNVPQEFDLEKMTNTSKRRKTINN